jgi:predicted PurR-regulated permease PerM
MNTAAEVLVIIVSAVLAIFLVVLIIVLVQANKILKQVRYITARAENVVDSMEAAASAFERTASPLAIIRIIGNIMEQTSKIRKRKD